MLTNDTEMQMESKIDEQPKTTSLPEEEESVDSNKKQDEQQQKSEHEKMNNSNGLEVAIMLPPPPVLVPFMAATVNPSADTRPPSSSAADKDEEEGLGLQVLSARSSTPYTVQGVCCANSNCAALEATTDAESNASQWKANQTELVANGERQTDAIVQNGIDKDDKNKHNHLNGHLGEDWKKYSRSDLMDIRNEMTIIRPECLEEARLDRLQFRKSDTGSIAANGMARNKSYRNPNPPNDLMPAFFKRKASTINPNPNAIVYDSFKYNDSNPFSHGNGQDNNYRRIGSGRISSGRQEVNWDYIPEEDPDRHQLPEFFNTKESLSSSKQQRSMQKQKYELDDNVNFAKRSVGNALLPGESSFRSHGSRHSINSSGEERYSSTASSSTANNKSDEPEWFSCGPTSRLDTIELSGFNESDQQKIRLEMSKNKPDSNNNRQDFTANKEKKHLAFQFDDFSTSHTSKVTGGGSAAAVHAGPNMPASKFMPLFNAKKKDEEPMVVASQNSTQSLNELFMFGGAKPVGQQKEKLSTTDMPSVDEIEAKWRGSIQPNSEAFNNSSENFKKMLHQLNQQQQQQGGIVGTSSMSSPPPATQRMNSQSANNQQQQQPMNLFNNENLSNFIKHRNLQQQLIQKQQQQAAFAQLQFNAILGRPDTQMLLLSLARGEISKHGLVVQLANPNLSQADREAISAALTFSTVGQFHQQMAINQNNQQQFIANQLQNLSLMQKQLNKSPIGAGRRNANQYSSPRAGASGSGYQQANNNHSGGSSPRTYTHEELQSHANFILHNAMLKKKLEEQNLGLQKMLHLQSTMMQNNNADSMAGTNKNLNHHSSHPYQQQQQQQQQQKQNHQNMHQQQQQQQRHRKAPSNAATRNNPPIGRRRSTSSSSSNTANSGNMTMNALHNNHLQLRRQLEQRRNTIATATVGGGGYRFLRPELELRRRRQAETYANYLYEIEEHQQQKSNNSSNLNNEEFQ